MRRLLHLATSLALMVSLPFSHASATQYCERTNYSAQEITDAVRNSPLRDELQQTSCALGGLGRFESGGNKGIYNGSCCTGIFQLNNTNISTYGNGMTRAQYGCLGLQDQVDMWARLTNDGYNTGVVRKLQAMGTFDGQPVDAAFIAACIQLGTGNCQKMVDSGRCSGFGDSNGTSICNMARNARAMADKGCQDGLGSCPIGPGDFNSPSPVGIAANPPSPEDASVIVGSGQV